MSRIIGGLVKLRTAGKEGQRLGEMEVRRRQLEDEQRAARRAQERQAAERHALEMALLRHGEERERRSLADPTFRTGRTSDASQQRERIRELMDDGFTLDEAVEMARKEWGEIGGTTAAGGTGGRRSLSQPDIARRDLPVMRNAVTDRQRELREAQGEIPKRPDPNSAAGYDFNEPAFLADSTRVAGTVNDARRRLNDATFSRDSTAAVALGRTPPQRPDFSDVRSGSSSTSGRGGSSQMQAELDAARRAFEASPKSAVDRQTYDQIVEAIRRKHGVR